MLGADKALQFFAGYVVELSLSVDNLFVFLLLFKFFQVTFSEYTGVSDIPRSPTKSLAKGERHGCLLYARIRT